MNRCCFCGCGKCFSSKQLLNELIEKNGFCTLSALALNLKIFYFIVSKWSWYINTAIIKFGLFICLMNNNSVNILNGRNKLFCHHNVLASDGLSFISAATLQVLCFNLIAYKSWDRVLRLNLKKSLRMLKNISVAKVFLSLTFRTLL